MIFITKGCRRLVVMRFSNFLCDQRGSVALIFAVVMVGIVFSVGGALDYAQTQSHKTTFQTALDAAVLAASAEEVRDQSEEQRLQAAREAFDANCTIDACQYTDPIQLQFNGNGVSGTTSANLPTSLLRTIGFHKFNVSVTSTVAAGSPGYADIFLIVDLSESMNIPDGDANIQALRALLPDPWSGNSSNRCAFACHTTGPGSAAQIGGKTFFEVARENNIWLRQDQIEQAAHSIVDAVEAGASADRFRFGIITFADTANLHMPLTNDFEEVRQQLTGHRWAVERNISQNSNSPDCRHDRPSGHWYAERP